MELHEPLTDRNWQLYAAKHYENPQCHDISEYHEDLRRIKYVKKSLTRYQQTGDLKERLVLNHLIVLCNVFKPEPLVRLLFFKMPDQLHMLKPFLLMLSVLPDFVLSIGRDGRNYRTEDIIMDPVIVTALRQI